MHDGLQFYDHRVVNESNPKHSNIIVYMDMQPIYKYGSCENIGSDHFVRKLWARAYFLVSISGQTTEKIIITTHDGWSLWIIDG